MENPIKYQIKQINKYPIKQLINSSLLGIGRKFHSILTFEKHYKSSPL